MNISNMSVHMAILWKFLGTIWTYKRFFARMNENMFLHCFLFRWKFGAYWTGEFLRPKFNWHQILQWIKTESSNFSIWYFFGQNANSIYSWFFLICLCIWPFCENFWGQYGHSKGLSPVWEKICVCITSLLWVIFGHIGQENSCGPSLIGSGTFCNK